MNVKEEIRRLGIQLEETNSNVKLILEVLSDHSAQLRELSILVSDIPEMKADIKTIKAALAATNRDVADHERRITKLESKTA